MGEAARDGATANGTVTPFEAVGATDPGGGGAPAVV